MSGLGFVLPSFRALFVIAITILVNAVVNAASIDQVLGARLSKGASIVHNSSAAPRWSEFDAPQPGTVVNVATEKDVAVTVQYCNQQNLTFLAQNGGNAWATTFHIGSKDVVINLAALNQIQFNPSKTQVTFQGGTTISQLVAAAYANGVQIPTGNCDCVGMLGATLGGGYGRLMGLYGFGVDNLLSVNVVNASGQLITVNCCSNDLWWALRGAGPNFGIVTSATMKSYPVSADQNSAWLGPLIFTEDKIESLVSAIDTLHLQPNMAIFLYFATSGPPDNTPMVIALPFYVGNNATAGKAAFASIYAVGPVADETAIYPYNQWNAGSASFCVKGERKPSFGAGLAAMVPATWRSVWNEYVAFLQNPGTGNSVVLLEAYSLDKAKSLPDSSSSFPFRSTVKFNAVAIPWYADASLDQAAVTFGSNVRSLWQSTDALASPSTYINFAFGDENLQTVYGKNVAKLQSLKNIYDPHGRFNQFFPL